jgi:TonB family protein
MNRQRKWLSLQFFYAAVLILGGCVTTPDRHPPPTPSQEGGYTPPRLDSDPPPRIGGQFYPVESKRLGEEGICVVRMQVDASGYVPATQLVSSSGFERLDAACMAGFANGHFRPATLKATPITTSINLPTAWSLSERSALRPEKLNDGQIALPIVKTDYALRVGPMSYPAEARSKHQEGACTVHVYIKEDGAAGNMSVSKSTGFATLDQACLLAVRSAQFVPAHANGSPSGAFADINITWRLPEQ